MSFFKKLFGGKDKPASNTPSVPPQTKSADPSKDPNMIKVFDAYGRELFITKESWRKNVLPGTIKSNWDNPDQLYGIIVDSLNGGFREDVSDAAHHLYQIDPNHVRAACIWGIILMDSGRLDAAEDVFQKFLSEHGEDGSILTNLAKVYSKRKNEGKAVEILWRALEVDPNLDNGQAWYVAIERESGGEPAAIAALRRIAALPQSWRAQLWLAREELKSRRTDEAIELYRDSLAKAPRPVPAHLLMQMSGDLGNAGHLPEILQLAEPHFEVAAHGLPVGNNLIKAHLDLGQLDDAKRILNQLYAQNRMDWKPHLSYWDTEITKARLATSEHPTQQLQIAMLTGEGPVWLTTSSPAAELFPAKTSDAPVVAFLGSSAVVATNSKRTEHQRSDTRGRLSRAIPQYLAEQVAFHTRARVQTLVPWITNEGGGFVLSGVPWTDDAAATYSRQGTLKSDYVVVSHIKTQAEPWTVEVRVIRAIDAKCLGSFSAPCLASAPQTGIDQIIQNVFALLATESEIEQEPVADNYVVPAGNNLWTYLLRLEQLLAVRCEKVKGGSPFLYGERDIIDGTIQLCLDNPKNAIARILLAQTLLSMKKVRPNILPEFRDKVTRLQHELPLAQPAQGIVERMLGEALN